MYNGEVPKAKCVETPPLVDCPAFEGVADYSTESSGKLIPAMGNLVIHQADPRAGSKVDELPSQLVDQQYLPVTMPPQEVCLLDEKQIAQFSDYVDILEIREKLTEKNLSAR